MTSNNNVAILVDDMFLASKINSTAAERGRKIERVKTREQLEALSTNPPALVIVDLNSDRQDPVDAIRYLKSNPDLRDVPIAAFVSHVQTDLIREAQAAGCDYVLARSAFTQMLGEIVAGNFDALRARS